MISEDTLRQALEEVDEAILSSLPSPSECEHQFSARFERKMRTVKYRAKHPMVYKTMQRAACVLLAVLILFSSVMAFSTNVRAAVLDWIKEQFGSFYHYFFVGDPNTDDQTGYVLNRIPDGYSLVNTQSSTSRETMIYFNTKGQMIQFSYLYSTDAAPAFVDNEKYEIHPVSIGTNNAEVFVSLSSNKTNGIVWVDSENGVLFQITGECSEDELIQLAESVKRKEK